MYLTRISISNFRVFNRLDIEVPRRIIMLIGGNAQGKTSFLEALHLFSILTSFQASSDRQLINFFSLKEMLPVARLVMSFNKGNQLRRMEIRLILENGRNGGMRLRKEVLVDGVKRSLQEALGNFQSVIFLPQMTSIIEGGPDKRRRYLNIVISQAYSGYAKILSEYQKAITQRNALLKQIAERHSSPQQLDYWDELISDRGASLIYMRIKTILKLEQLAKQVHKDLSNQLEVLRIVYQPSYDPYTKLANQNSFKAVSPVGRSKFSKEQIKLGFWEALQKVRREEVLRGVTTIGPQRDEIRFLINGFDLGIYGSRGQIRSSLLSLKIAEVNWLHDISHEWPVLLLDETMAELDLKRRDSLIRVLQKGEQAILTTIDANQFTDDFVQSCAVWKIKNGRIVV